MARFTKAELGRIKPGTWVTVMWKDTDMAQAILLLERINVKEHGDITLKYFDPAHNCIKTLAVHKQIVGVGDRVTVPEAQVQSNCEGDT
jgi:hypothetical protein